MSALDELKSNTGSGYAEQKVAERPVEAGSAEDYLGQSRTEIEYNSKLCEELRDKLRSACRPETDVKATSGPESHQPVSPLADAFAQASVALARNNEILRDILRRLDLP